MSKLQFECRSAEREAEDLMAETNSEDWFLAHQIAERLVCVGERGRISWPVGQKDSVRILGQGLPGRGRRGDNRHPKPFLAEQPQNILFDPVIVSDDPKTDRR